MFQLNIKDILRIPIKCQHILSKINVFSFSILFTTYFEKSGERNLKHHNILNQLYYKNKQKLSFVNKAAYYITSWEC